MPWVCAIAAGWMHSGQLPHARRSARRVHGRAVGGVLVGRPGLRLPAPTCGGCCPGAWGFWSTAALLVLARRGQRSPRPRARSTSAWAQHGRRPALVARVPRPPAAGVRALPHRQGALVVDPGQPERVIVGTIAKPAGADRDRGRRADLRDRRAAQRQDVRRSIVPAVLEHAGPVVTTATKTDVVHAHAASAARAWARRSSGIRSASDRQLGSAAGLRGLVPRAARRALAGRTRSQLGETASDRVLRRGRAGARRAAAARGRADARQDDRRRLPLGARPRASTTPAEILSERRRRRRAARACRPSTRSTSASATAIIGTMQVQLKAYGHPAAARTAARGASGISARAPVRRRAEHRLPRRRPRAPAHCSRRWSVTMLCSLCTTPPSTRTAAARRSRRRRCSRSTRRRRSRRSQELPQILSVSLSSGIRFVTVWHSLAQIRERYGIDGAATILALSQAKVFLGSITDEVTRQELCGCSASSPRSTTGTRVARHAHRAGAAAPASRPGPARPRRAAARLLHAAPLLLRPDPAAPAAAMTTRRPHRLARRAAAILGNDDTLLTAAQARLGERVHAAVILDVGAGTLRRAASAPPRRAAAARRHRRRRLPAGVPAAHARAEGRRGAPPRGASQPDRDLEAPARGDHGRAVLS